ncbi:MAG: NTP transferase domain-containing protein [Deltaproteobacteria bacterium]|nr:NTP transferase domain-containing protein [Deltaproteobacteria bacterium]
MKAVILTGGVGKRLRPLTYSIPKPLVTVGDKAIIECVIQQLKKHNIDDLILATGYLSALVEDHCKDGKQWGVKISYQHEEKALGTAGPLSLLKEKLKSERHFVLMNGDIVTNIDFSHLIRHHISQQNALTIVSKNFEWQCPFGVIQMSKNNVVEIEEKPTTSYKISCGIYLLDSLCLQYIPKDLHFTVPDLVKALVKGNHRVGAFMTSDYWKGVETIEDLEEILKIIEKKDFFNTPLEVITFQYDQRVTSE